MVRQPAEQSPHSVPRELEILRRFDFSSKKQRMSALVRNRHTGELMVYVKGAPEVIADLCLPDTIPDDYAQVLNTYTKTGYRVLGCAYAKISVPDLEHALRIPRANVEINLNFCGFLIMQNKLKGDTTSSIVSIKNAGIRTIMVTGDNALTAISVARECTLSDPNCNVFLADVATNEKGEPTVQFTLVRRSADEEEDGQPTPSVVHPTLASLLLEQSGMQNVEIAVTGKAFAILENDPLFHQLLIRASVFARMTPDQKTKLVETLALLGYRVAMCGDGANDCGALKAADVGLSLSEAEASIAAPFTSSSPTIASMITLLREGKAALATSIQCFKFMAMYSVIESATVVMLYSRDAVPSDLQYLYIDLITILPIAFLMARTGATRQLGRQKPPSRLVSTSVMVSLLGQVIIQLAFQVFVLFYVVRMSFWYDDLSVAKQQGVVDDLIFAFANFQYLSVAVGYSISRPFRKPLWTNRWFMASLIVLGAFDLYLLLGPWDPIIRSWFSMSDAVPFPAKMMVLALAALDFAVTYLYEKIVVVWLLTNRSWTFTTNRPLYKILMEEGPLATDTNEWEMRAMSTNSSNSLQPRLFDEESPDYSKHPPQHRLQIQESPSEEP